MDNIANSPLLSIVICTYNRVYLLRDAIFSILNQDYQNEDYELIIVDNNSTDLTLTVFKEFASSNSQLKYILETNVGLSHARNRGWQEAKGKYIAYIDDDCKAPSKWLSRAIQIIISIKPDAFGGPSFPFYQSEKPEWFKNAYATFKKIGNTARELSADEYFEGMNMVFTKKILKKMGGFNSEFGMKGSTIAYGEETDLLNRMRESNPEVFFYFDPDFYIEHLVRPEKMTWKWIIRQKFADGRDYYNLFPDKKIQISVFRIIYRILKNIWLLLLDILFRVYFRDREKYPYSQNYYYEQTTKHIAAFGEIAEQLREKLHYAGK